MTAPEDTVRVSRHVVDETISRLNDIATIIDSTALYRDAEFLRATAKRLRDGILSTPPASPDAGGVELPLCTDPRIGVVVDAWANATDAIGVNGKDFFWAYRFIASYDALRAFDVALATPSAPEDKGEGVNELVAKIEAKHGEFWISRNGKLFVISLLGDHEPLSIGPDLDSALRAAAASDTERG